MDMKKSHILIVDDDSEIRDLLAEYLAKYQFRVSTAKNGDEMKKVLAQGQIDLILLDVMLPGTSGINLCKEVRRESDIPIIMLTANDDETDRIVGLEVGADDYQTKPYNPRELLARINAVLRRYHKSIVTRTDKGEKILIYNFGGWKLDTATRQVTSPDNEQVNLSSGEYDLLLIFLERPQRVLSRNQLLNLTHNRDAEPFDRSIDVQISRLRQKLEEDHKNPTMIKTIRGGGYMLSLPVKREEL